MRKRLVSAILAVIMVCTLFTSVMADGAVNTAGINDFVTRMYSVCLDRNPDQSGLDYWSNQLINKKATGCSVAAGFIFSSEFQNKQCSNEEYATYMYKAFFGRNPDQGGLNYWVGQLNGGMSRTDVFIGFANSKEFAGLCSSYGIVKGYYIKGVDPNQGAMVSLFVERLYNEILGRSCDDAGMAYWTEQLCSHKKSGSEVAFDFVFSNELKNKNLCNDHYVEMLYKAFMGRSSDASGKSHWIDMLKAGTSREVVFNGFAASQEFKGICDSYGIITSVITIKGSGTYAHGACAVCGTVTNGTSTGTTGTSTGTGSSTGSTTGTGSTSTGTTGTTGTTTTQKSGWVIENNKYYYYDPSTGEMAKGWKKIDNTWYYFDETFGYKKTGYLNQNGVEYYFDDDGKMVTGWVQKGEYWYYYASNGALHKGLLEYNNNLYYMSDYTGVMLTGLRMVNGDYYYFEDNGKAHSGWHQSGSSWSYYDPTTKKATVGLKEISGVTYYFSSTGVMQTGLTEIKNYDDNGKYLSSDYYYFKDSGAMVKGFYDAGNNSLWFFDETTGKAHKAGWVKDSKGNYYYCTGATGQLAVSKVVSTKSGPSYVGKDGKCKYGWVTEDKYYTYYADSNGYLKSGLQTIGGKQYYFDPVSFYMYKNTYVSINGSYKYVDSNGVVQ